MRSRLVSIPERFHFIFGANYPSKLARAVTELVPAKNIKIDNGERSSGHGFQSSGNEAHKSFHPGIMANDHGRFESIVKRRSDLQQRPRARLIDPFVVFDLWI